MAKKNEVRAIKAIQNPEANMVFNLEGKQYPVKDMSVQAKALTKELDGMQKALQKCSEDVLRWQGAIGYMTGKIKELLAHEEAEKQKDIIKTVEKPPKEKK